MDCEERPFFGSGPTSRWGRSTKLVSTRWIVRFAPSGAARAEPLRTNCAGSFTPRSRPSPSGIAQAEVDPSVLVSVIMPTRNRAPLLPRAIRSVLDQLHPNLQLIVVDDGSEDETRDVVSSFTDPRIEYVRIEHSGAARAVNCGIERARGSIIAYLDDDNRMMPDWLRAVVWAFDRCPDRDVLYGARLKDRIPAEDRLPKISFEPWDRATLVRMNIIDQNALAHRAGLPEARFDGNLRALFDWDLVTRLTADTDPLELPVISCVYSTTSPNRLSTDVSEADWVAARAKVSDLRRPDR